MLIVWGEALSAWGELALTSGGELLTGDLVGTDQVIFPSFFCSNLLNL